MLDATNKHLINTKVQQSEQHTFNQSQEQGDTSLQKWLNDTLTFEEAWNEVTPINWEYWLTHPCWNRENAAWLFYGIRPYKTKCAEIPEELDLKITEFTSMAISKEVDLLSPSEWLAWGKENNFKSLGGIESALTAFMSIKNTKFRMQSVIPNQAHETVVHKSDLTQILPAINRNDNKEYFPVNAIGKLAIQAAKQIEKKTNRVAAAKEVINLLQEWADNGSEPDVLKESRKEKRAVVWVTSTLKDKEYDTDACRKTLEKWKKSRKSTGACGE